MKILSMFQKLMILMYSNERYIAFLRRKGVYIGSDCIVDKTAVFGTEPYLVSLDDKVRVTRNVQFITHDGALWVVRNLGLVDKNADYFGKIVVGSNTNIGWNVMIMPGVTIGKNCIIGAGAIVTKDIPDNSVVVGIPARVIKSVEEYAEKKKPYCVNTKHLSNEEKRRFLQNCKYGHPIK